MFRYLMSVAAAAALTTTPAWAGTVVGFTGDFAPANWTSVVGANGAAPSADASFLSISSPAPEAEDDDVTTFSIVMPKSGTVKFSWVFNTSDEDEDPFFDPFGFLTGDGSFFTQLTDDAGAIMQSGTASVFVEAGETFGFAAFALVGDFGTATTRVGNFRVQFVPEPTSLLLMAAALAAATATRRRQTVRR